MIEAKYYSYIYIIVVFVMTMFKVYEYSKKVSFRMQQRKKEPLIGAVILTLLMILFIGFRPISDAFGDMPGYAIAMVDGRFEGREIRWDTNYVFEPMMAFLSSHGASKRTPIVILALINFGATFVAMKKMFPKDVMLAMLVFFGAFSTFGAATNGLKAGCAAALFLVALAYRDRKIICLIFLFLSMGFHHSMQLPIMAFVICSLYKNTKVYVVLWVICLFLAAAHVTYFMSLFEGFTDEIGARYLDLDKIAAYQGKTGFRLDFVLYSAMPLVLGYYFKVKKRVVFEKYRFLLNLYLLINGIWLLCMHAQFTNRIAYLSWSLYPVMILYPFLNTKTERRPSKLLRNIVSAHVAFTAIMYLIIYV